MVCTYLTFVLNLQERSIHHHLAAQCQCLETFVAPLRPVLTVSSVFFFFLQNMFELSSRLIGIYKVANQTRSVAIGELLTVFFWLSLV